MKIFPKEILENTTQVFQFKHSTKSKIIYSIILFSIISVLISLPFIKVDIYTPATGIIKPNIERVPLLTINSGRVLYSILNENIQVQKGDTILIIENKLIEEELILGNRQIEQIESFIQDLNYLLSTSNPNIKNLFTGKYKAAFLEYNQNLMEQKFRFKQKKSMFERNKLLFDKGVIAASVFENSKTEFDLSQSYLSSTRNQTYNTWQVELVNYNDALKEFQTNENKLLENKSQFFVTAPISGTLFNTAQLRQGSFVSQGSKLAEISPSTDLIVECYINPKDIGLIDPNNKVIFQIDAYNYNQWGLANGDVIDIGKDIVIIDQQPIFRVRCKLNENHLALKNGVKGDIKKGMTVRARFLLIEQSLFDLLYNDIDDWLNPASA